MERVILTASDGMVYTNGISGGKKIYLAEGQSADGWYEIAEQTFLAAQEQGIAIEEANDADYRAALREFGVDV